jgi:hypothetical protein
LLRPVGRWQQALSRSPSFALGAALGASSAPLWRPFGAHAVFPATRFPEFDMRLLLGLAQRDPKLANDSSYKLSQIQTLLTSPMPTSERLRRGFSVGGPAGLILYLTQHVTPPVLKGLRFSFSSTTPFSRMIEHISGEYGLAAEHRDLGSGHARLRAPDRLSPNHHFDSRARPCVSRSKYCRVKMIRAGPQARRRSPQCGPLDVGFDAAAPSLQVERHAVFSPNCRFPVILVLVQEASDLSSESSRLQ